MTILLILSFISPSKASSFLIDNTHIMTISEDDSVFTHGRIAAHESGIS
jgi:hypothetical protein